MAAQPGMNYLFQVAFQLEALAKAKCTEVVAYSAVLGDLWWTSQVKVAPSKFGWDAHQCYFRFVLWRSGVVKSATEWHDQGNSSAQQFLVPLDAARLPFKGKSMRRNVKILKMLGHQFFPWARTLIWIDGKLVLGATKPEKVFAKSVLETSACMSFVGLPVHKNAFGEKTSTEDATLYQHGVTLIQVSGRSRGAGRPPVTDSADMLKMQLEDYGGGTNFGVNDMSDTAYFFRNMASPRCRPFIEEFGCRWLNEITYYSDRDQVSFPWVLRSPTQMGLVPRSTAPGINNFSDKLHVFSDKAGHPWLTIIPATQHWYNTIELAFLLANRPRLPSHPFGKIHVQDYDPTEWRLVPTHLLEVLR